MKKTRNLLLFKCSCDIVIVQLIFPYFFIILFFRSSVEIVSLNDSCALKTQENKVRKENGR